MPTKTVKIDGKSLKLDARPDRLDLRDRPYIPILGNLPAKWPSDEDVKTWLPEYAKQGLILNQGSEGACTGFGLAAVINSLLFVRRIKEQQQQNHPSVSPAMLYQLARMYDEWPGEDYEGSSCRGALKGWQRHGVCRKELWPFILDGKGHRVPTSPIEDANEPDNPNLNWDIDALDCTLGVYYRVDMRSVIDLQAAILQTGAIYVSATVHEGWGISSRKKLNGHDDLIHIKPIAQPKNAGGHAFALIGYNEQGFVVQNSWGENWGSRGFALLPYEDWIIHGTDAWVFTLGVPAYQKASKQVLQRSPRFLVTYNSTISNDAPDRSSGLITGGDSLTRRYQDLKKPEHRPLDADQAYSHTILLDRGFPVRNDITAENAQVAVQSAVLDRPLAWLKDQEKPKLMIYAHGGLNSENASINRIRVMAPYALANGIYPLFITWRSGGLETVSDLVEECFAKLGLSTQNTASILKRWRDNFIESTDRMLELVSRAPGGAMWGQMKLNTERASSNQGGIYLMAQYLKPLIKEIPHLEIHLIGHSAGSIMLGTMLEKMEKEGLKVASLRLFAPACTVEFANRYFINAINNKVLQAEHFHIHVLSDQNELNDNVGPYRKSLLYLVSRAFEYPHKMPLLGMERIFSTKSNDDGMWDDNSFNNILTWQNFWKSHNLTTSHLDVLTNKHKISNGLDTLPYAHGCFDNSVEIMGKALGYIVNSQKQPTLPIERLDY